MIAYIKKFWVTLLGSFLFGIVLAIFCWNPPWQFFVSLAIFVFLLNAVIEQASNLGAVAGVVKKITLFVAGVLIFVGLRVIAGYFLDMPASQTYQEVTSGNDILGIHVGRISRNIAFELLFLVPGMAIAYLVVKEGRFWKTILVVICALLLCWVAWTIKQKTHAEAMKRQTQALVSLNARVLNNKAMINEKALINEAAAATSFGIAKETISVFYQWDAGTTNLVENSSITNRLEVGEKVLQLRPNEQPIIFEGQAFTEVVLLNTNGSFVGGTKTWVEAWKFNWVDGRNNIIAPTSSASTKPKFEAMPAGTHLIRVAPKEETNWKVIPKDLYWSLSARNDGGNWQLKPFNGHSVQYKTGQSQLADITGLGNTIKLVNDGDKELEFDLVVKP